MYKEIFKNSIKSNLNIVAINTHKVIPKLTQEENTKATQLLSSFSTSIAKSTPERKHNVKLALSAFNGKRIEAGEEVSFNKTTGRRTEKNGYKTAHIILNEVFVDGVGGGVCQSSTTLYNALLLADNVKIKQATRHSMPVGYVQLGFDAMVSYGSSDLVFQNNSKYPMFLHTYTKNNNVYVEVYGAPNEKQYTKKRRTEIIKTLDAKPDKTIVDKDGKYFDKVKYKGETHRLKWPQKGYEVQTYIDYYNDEEFVGAVPVRHTTYPAQEGIIIEGSLDNSLEEQQSCDFNGDDLSL